ncbi:MAG: trypsin-like peptidase domain-containing protein [Phormidium tanganyikae FI6-MK23]|nr:trypsin-like peptidase domain-containing protein [Phormidium tanganyikae FI6-MK23]
MDLSSSTSPKLKDLERFIEAVWSPTSLGDASLENSSSLSSEEPDLSVSQADLPLSEHEILNSYVERYREKLSIYKPRISAVIGQPDFQSVSFLPIGLERSNAVCRIARYCCPNTLQKIFNSLRTKAEKIAEKFPAFDRGNSFNPLEELRASFSIPFNLFNAIFRENLQTSELTYLEAIDILEKNIDDLLKLNPFPLGTGFLVGGSHLLTNHHVIPTEAVAEQCVAQFSYEDKPEQSTSLDYNFNPKFFVSNSQLDYTLVQLKPNPSTRRSAGYRFGWIDLIDSKDTVVPSLNNEQIKQLIDRLEEYGYTQEQLENYALTRDKDTLPGDRVAIVQHPRGRKKEIVLQDNAVDKLSTNNIDYKADTDYGSSGSPVFDMNWKLVALTKRVVPKLEQLSNASPIANKETDAAHNQANNPENNSNQNGTIRLQWIDSQGTRICRIVEDLKRKSTDNPKLQSFIEDFVITAEQLNYPPLPAGLKFNGIHDYVSTDSKIVFASCATSSQRSSDSRTTELGIGTIKLWNSIGVELRTLIHPGVSKIEFSSDSQQLVSADDSQLRLWNVETGELVRTMTPPNYSDNREARLEHFMAEVLQEASPIDADAMNDEIDLRWIDSLSLRPPNYELLAVASSPSEKITLWNTKDGSLHNLPDGDLLKSHPELKDLKGLIVRFSPTGEILAASSQTNVQLWQVDNWSLLKTIETAEFSKICFSLDGNIIAIANASLRFVDVESGSISEPIKADAGEIEFRTVNETEVLMSLCRDGLVRSWNLDGTLHQEVEIDPTVRQQSIQSTSFSPDGKVLLIFGLGNDISLCSLETGTVLRRINHLNMRRRPAEFPIAEAKFSPNAPVLDQIDANSANYTRSLTVEAWVNPDLNGGGTIADIVLHPIQGQPATFPLEITADSGELACLRFAGSGMGILNFGKFYHLTLVINLEEGSLETISYINGQLSSTSSSSSHFALPFFPHLQLIGASLEQDANFTSTLMDFFKGTISEIRLWNTARSLKQIRANMFKRLSSTEEGLVEYWKFEGDEASKILGLVSKKGALGIAREAKQLNANQLYGFSLPYGLKFSEDHDLVNTTFVSSDVNEGLETAITVEAWVKHQFGNSFIVSRGRQDTQGSFLRQGYSIGLHNGKIRVVIQNESHQESIVTETRETVFQDQIWHHVAFTWAYDDRDHRKGGEVSIYMDGRLQDSVVIEGRSKTIVAVGKTQTSGVFAGSLESVTDPLQIGIRAEFGKYRSVVIADVRIWNVCRPQDQIKANMSRRLNSNPEGLIGYWRLDEGDNDQVVNLVSKIPATVHGATWFPMPPASEQMTL